MIFKVPLYNFINKDTKEVFEDFMSISVKEKYLLDNPNIEQLLSAPALGDSIRLGLRKPDSAFRDRLKEIKKAHSKGFTRSSVNTFD
jgi:hypothetical protein